jgi:hypothetical protein
MNHDHLTITPREQLDFGLDDGDLPRHWFGGDPYKTRFFDAMSTTFPDGERLFMMAVRAFKDTITDPALLQDIKDFNRQEGQHGIVHSRFNEVLRGQGIDIDKLLRIHRFIQFDIYWKYFPRVYNHGLRLFRPGTGHGHRRSTGARHVRLARHRGAGAQGRGL